MADIESVEGEPTRYVCGFLFSEDESRVLLIEKNRPAWQKGKYNGVGGHIEPSETPLDAMRREFHEETGTYVDAWKPVAELTGADWRVHFFSAHSDKAMLNARNTTDECLVRVVVSQLHYVGRLIPNLRVLIPLALDDSGIVKPVIMTDYSAFVKALPKAA